MLLLQGYPILSILILRTKFINNSSPTGGMGSALYLLESAPILIQNCEFLMNSADFGGAIYFSSSDGDKSNFFKKKH